METVARTNEVERNIMREILFKAKRVDNGEWVEGLLTVMWGQYHMINPNDENTAYPIDTETICQYTGLADKNGNRIWENDIVEFPDCEMPTESGYGDVFVNVGKVAYDTESMSYFFTNRVTVDMGDIIIKDEVEVIGNVFDNPELFED